MQPGGSFGEGAVVGASSGRRLLDMGVAVDVLAVEDVAVLAVDAADVRVADDGAVLGMLGVAVAVAVDEDVLGEVQVVVVGTTPQAP